MPPLACPAVDDFGWSQRGGRASLTALLLGAMGVATFAPNALGVLAVFLIEDLGISRGQLGAIIGLNLVMGALVSPRAGAVTDRLGARRALLALFATSALTFVALALAPAVAPIAAVAAVGGVTQGLANPATNKLIAGELPVGSRAFVTGVKQSGVQAAVFVGGFTLPGAALAFGWRPTLLLVALVPALGLPFTLALVARSEGTAPALETESIRRLPGGVLRLTGYGLLVGFGAAFSLTVPLFAEEAVGLTAVAAGVVFGAAGLVAVVGRVLWARWAEQSLGERRALAIIALLGLVSTGGLVLAPRLGPTMLWVGALLLGFSGASWNSVGMLAAMRLAGVEGTGRASGWIVMGFLVGVAAGPPVFGATVDSTGTYDVALALCAIAFLGATAVVLGWGRHDR